MPQDEIQPLVTRQRADSYVAGWLLLSVLATLDRETSINLVPLIRFIRTNAAKRGIDLLFPFVPPPDDPRLSQLLTPWTEARYHAIDVLKAFRKGDEEAAARAGKLARSALETYAGRPEGTSVQ